MDQSFILDKWNHITVSGKAATGSTTLAKALSQKLGWKLLIGGDLVREYVHKHKIPLEKTTKTPDQFHLELDRLLVDKMKNENNLIIESWLSGFDAKNIEGVYKILLTCNDNNERVRRLIERDQTTEKKAQKHIRLREEENLKKWKRLYKTTDFWNPKDYNLVIDTSEKTPRQTLDIVLKKIGYPMSKN